MSFRRQTRGFWASCRFAPAISFSLVLSWALCVNRPDPAGSLREDADAAHTVTAGVLFAERLPVLQWRAARRDGVD